MWDEKLERINSALAKTRRPHDSNDLEFQKYYFQIDGLVDTMQENLDGVLRKHEMGYVETYRNHMRRVTRDLDKYKKALNEKEFDKRRDDRVVKLQGNVEWFKNEALELSKANLKLKEEILLLKQKCMILDEEKQIAENTAQKVKLRTE